MSKIIYFNGMKLIESEYLKDNLAILEKIRRIPTLSSFSKKDLKGVLELSKIRKYEQSEIIIEEGVFDSWIYFLVSGEVKVVKHDNELSVLKRTGDVFGEMGIIDGSPRSATIYALKETVCLAADASYIDRLSGNDKIIFSYILYRLFAEILAKRLRLTSEELIKLKEEKEI